MKTNLFIHTLTTAALSLLLAACSPVAKETKPTAAKPNPLDMCVVTGEKLGGMGKAFVFTHDGREIKLCCKSCQPDFEKEPAKFLAKLDTAAKDTKK